MYNRILKLPIADNDSIFLFGPRGVGKTSWIKKHLPQAFYLDLLDFNNYHSLTVNPSRLEDIIPEDPKQWVVIDEIQRVPEALNEVHRLIENKGYRFLLTGSSSRKLKHSGVNLLAGRALTYHLHPLIIQELKEDFSISTALTDGLLPKVYTSGNPKKFLGTYVQTYLREEVMQEGLTRKLDCFSRFLEIASFSQGSVLNHSNIAQEVGVSRFVVANYFSILEDLLLAVTLQPFTKRAKRRLVQHPKFYYFDVGVYRYLRPTGPLDISDEIDGMALETLFLQHLRAINDYFDLGYEIYYWRTNNGAEVDFVLYGKNGLHAFEIKKSDRLEPKVFSGLKAFGDDYEVANLYLIYGGKRREHHGRIQVIPMIEALDGLPKILSAK